MTMDYQLIPESRHFPPHNQRQFYISGTDSDASSHSVTVATPWQQFVKSSHGLTEESALGPPFQCWHPQELSTVWPGPTEAPSSFRAGNPSNSGFSTPPDYPESSQRTVLPSSSPTNSQSTPPPNSCEIHLSQSPARAPEYGDDTWCATTLYSMDEREMTSFPPLSSDSPPPVKEEPDDDDCFIMELAAPPTHLGQALAPPTEVPLRATQASKEMRKMMGVFRLNPFAMHSGAGRGAVPSSWYSGEAGPLDKEPLVFEFQVDLDGLPVLESPSGTVTEALRSFSPYFEVGSLKDEGERTHRDWPECETEVAFQPSSDETPSWGLAYPPDEYISASDSTSTPEFPVRRSVRLHSNSSYPYPRRNLYHENFPSSPTNSSVEMNRMRMRRPPSQPSWSAEEYIENPRVTGFVGSSSSSECDIEGLPSFSAAVGRRWSVPGANPQAPFLM